jgi:hypothetical protein
MDSIAVYVQLGQTVGKKPPLFKITRAKRTECVAQVVERFCKHKALSLSPSSAKKKERKKKD